MNKILLITIIPVSLFLYLVMLIIEPRAYKEITDSIIQSHIKIWNKGFYYSEEDEK